MSTTRTIFLMLAPLLVMTQPGAAQLRLSAIKLGFLDPKDAKAGFILGTEIADEVDESVSLGLSVNLFHKSFNATKPVADRSYPSGVHETTIEKQLEFNTTFLPIMAQATVFIPSTDGFGWYLGGGLGYEFLWNNEKNFETDDSERRFYKGFSWLVDTGLRYRLGSRSSLLFEVFYHHATVKRNKEESAAGLPVWSEVDLSGLGFRFGLGFSNW